MIVHNTSFILLLCSAFLDYLVGDPWGWPHPVQFMGGAINFLSKLIVNLTEKTFWRRLGGIFLGCFIILGCAISSWLVIRLTYTIHWAFGFGIEVILLASCFAGRSLRDAAMDVLEPLNQGDLALARSRLSNYVGRDTENLSETEIYRAVLETVAENATDGVTAPLFYALVGCFLPMVGVVPLAIAYKAASTLDSMIGYLQEPLKDIGWFSAKLEDKLTWLPCRLTVLTLGLWSGNPKGVWSICQRDGIKDPSPNSGWSEAVYAAILGVQLGGTNTYNGVVKNKPLLGDRIHPITSETVKQALNLTRVCVICWLTIATILGFFTSSISFNS